MKKHPLMGKLLGKRTWRKMLEPDPASSQDSLFDELVPFVFTLTLAQGRLVTFDSE